MTEQSKYPRPAHLRLVHPAPAHEAESDFPELGLTDSTPEDFHESAHWAPARLIVEMADANGEPFQLELTIIHRMAQTHCQERAVQTIRALRPHLWARGYTVDHIHALDGLGNELFSDFNHFDPSI